MAGASSCTTAAVTLVTNARVTTASASNSVLGGGQLSITSDTQVVPLFQFKARYQLSEITSDIRERMTTAVANLLQVNTSSIFLSFALVTLRNLQQQEFVLVSVGLVNFQESRAAFASMITQENIDSKMAAAGLKSVELLTSVSGSPTAQGTICIYDAFGFQLQGF
jgi:uncharacterized membrane protein